MSNSYEGYKFNIQNGAVTAVYEYEHGQFQLESMDWDESWRVDESGNVVKTEYDDGRLENSVYADTNGDGIYFKVGEYYGSGSTSAPATGSNPSTPTSYANGYEFDVVNGEVTQVYEWHNGIRSVDRIDANESWALSAGQIIKTEYEYGLTANSVYTDVDGDGIYIRDSKTYSATAAPASVISDNSTVSTYRYSDGYRFDIANGVVNQVYEIDDGRLQAEYMSPNETWDVNGDTVVKTEVEHGLIKQKTYADPDGDGVFTPIAQSYSPLNDASSDQGGNLIHVDSEETYQFDISDDLVQQAYEVRDGLTRPDILKQTETWTTNGTQVIKTDIEYGVISESVYEDSDEDGIYERVSSTHTDSTGKSLADNLEYTPLFECFVNGQTEYKLPEHFSGPDSLNLKYQLIDSSHNAVLKGSDDNDFIKVDSATSSGKAVDGAGGDDVIDGGVGSTFITGGAGVNIFFIDGRASGDSWSTITDFNIGVDKVTIWGWRDGVSKVAAIEDNAGAQGYEGVTLHFEDLLESGADGSVSGSGDWHSLTFAGKTLADFGVDSVDALNAQIIADANPLFSTGYVTDDFGTHEYLYIA